MCNFLPGVPGFGPEAEPVLLWAGIELIFFLELPWVIIQGCLGLETHLSPESASPDLSARCWEEFCSKNHQES